MNTKGSGTCLRGNKYVDALRHWAVLPPPKPLKIAKGSAAKQQAVVLERYPTITSEQWWSWLGRTICALLTVVLILLPLFAASPTPWGSLVTTIHSPVKDGSKVYVGIDEACDLLQQHCGEFSPNDLGPLHRQEDSSVHVVKRKTSSKSTGGFRFTNPFKRKKKQRKSGGGEADEEDALASYVANHLGAPALFTI
ncbi:hypothetical protein QFC24_000459 [Naganishia onofrii]|uniref:Uncharacterized protein n=1 Tax=Naganishia onofrii TaxID=1851511 RepID=A0ACC2XW25_9TREE|nr:hypothetical protein QFC24_000459 [Naganishia onofrii]